MNPKSYIYVILLIFTSLSVQAQDTTSVKKMNFVKRYWQSLINGNVDRTHEKPFDVSFAVDPSYSREGFGFGGTATGLYILLREIVCPKFLGTASMTNWGRHSLSVAISLYGKEGS